MQPDIDNIFLVGWEEVSDVKLRALRDAVMEWKHSDSRWTYHEVLCKRYTKVCDNCPNWMIKNANTDNGLCRTVRSRVEIEADDIIELIDDELEQRFNGD